MAPRLERDDDRERHDDEREQEVRHHRERVEIEDHGQPAKRDLGNGASERAERGAPHPAVEVGDPARREPCDEGGENPAERDDAVSELDDRVEVLGGERRRAATRPVVAPEPGAGQADERARGDDEAERDHSGDREPQKPGGLDRPPEPPATTHESKTPAPSSTRPIASSVRPAAAKVAASTACFSAGSVTRRPPAVCGS